MHKNKTYHDPCRNSYRVCCINVLRVRASQTKEHEDICAMAVSACGCACTWLSRDGEGGRVEVAMTANAAGRSRLSREGDGGFGEADKSPVASLPEAIEESGAKLPLPGSSLVGCSSAPVTVSPLQRGEPPPPTTIAPPPPSQCTRLTSTLLRELLRKRRPEALSSRDLDKRAVAARSALVAAVMTPPRSDLRETAPSRCATTARERSRCSVPACSALAIW
mmetsp:Transcript_26246/g.76201  ORF Transcript_26246/g.76201 Transcript_26246/m.76201 type:complete len:221 (+) Transcript_26246:54-716(+)